MKRFSKTFILVFAIISVLIFALTGCSNKIDAELVNNGNFEQTNQNDVLGWEFYSSSKQGSAEVTYPKFSPGSVESQKYGVRYAQVKTSNYGVGYLTTKVKLYSGQKYALSVDYNIKSAIVTQSGDSDAIGAYFGFLEDKYFLDLVITNKTTSGWINRTIYFTPTSTANYTFVAGIGREDLGGATGTVQFDNLSIKAVKDVPAGFNLSKLNVAGSIGNSKANGIAYTVILTLLGVCMIVGAYYLLRKNVKNTSMGEDNSPLYEPNDNSNTNTNNNADSNDNQIAPKRKKTAKEIFLSPIAMFVYVVLSAFAIRFILLMTLQGMRDQLVELGKISLILAEDGPSKLYGITNTSLPSGMLYILWAIGEIGTLVEFTESSIGMTMMLRIPNIIADLITCYLIFNLLASNYNYKHSSIVAGLYALLPCVFTASTGWGMDMSIAMAFIMAMLTFMVNKKHIYVPIMFTLGLAFSNLMLIALPVVVAYQIYYCIIDKKSIWTNILSSLLCLVAFYCISIPFALSYFGTDKQVQGIFLVFAKMLENIKSNNLISNSSFNFYAIFGLGANASTTAMIVVVAIIMVLFGVLAGYMYSKSRNRLDFILITALSFILWTVFGIGSRISNMIIGVVLLLVYSTLKMEKRVFKVFGVLSVTSFVNIAVLLMNSGMINIKVSENAGFSAFYKLDPLYIIGSIIVVIATVYLLWVAFDIMVNKLENPIKEMPVSLKEEFLNNYNTKKNWFAKKIKRNK